MTDSHDGLHDRRFGKDAEGAEHAEGEGRVEHAAYEERTEGGDPVCWLDRVCDECGAMREDMRAARCARCGTPFHGAGSDSVQPAPDH